LRSALRAWVSRSHRRRIRTTNGLELLNQEIKRRTRVVRIFPNRVDHLSVILEGEFSWSKRVDGGEVVMNTYGPGEFFAEVPLLLGKPFLATWRALADSRVFALPNEPFRRMLTTYPSFSNTVLEMMAQRIQVLYSVAQQRERLSSLGTLAAGLPHELNNPTSASRRAAGRLRDTLENRLSLSMGLTRAAAHGEIDPVQLDALERIIHEVSGRDNAPARNSLERSDLEDEEIQDRIFEPFFTTKDVGKGAGFGLDVSYRIVVGRHGGDIRIVSKPGDTRFQVRLPMEA
jgi:signal transduction histidine kinase